MSKEGSGGYDGNDSTNEMGDESKEERNVFRRPFLKLVGVGATFATSGLASAQADRRIGGSEHWSFTTDGAVETSPTVVNGTVFVSSDDGNLYAIDAESGTSAWDSPFATGGEIYSSPAVSYGTVYTGSADGNLYAIDAAEGTEKWRFDVGETEVDSSPTVSNGVVYVGASDGNVYALNAADGSEYWDSPFETENSVYSSPTVADGTVYVGSDDNNVYAIDAESGTSAWDSPFETGDSVVSSPTVADGTVYVGSYDRNIYALDAADGTQVWRTNLDSSVYASPTVADGTVYVGDYSFGNLHVLDAETGDGSVLGADVTTNPLMSSATVADGVVFVGDGDGLVHALDPGAKSVDQVQQWDSPFETGGTIESSPTVVEGTVYVGSDDGSVYAIDAGVAGSSSDTRVELGTLGHHFEAAESDDSGETQVAIDVAPGTLQYGARVVGEQPTNKFTVTNTTDSEIELTANAPGQVEFVEDWWFLPDKFDSGTPPVTIGPGESAPFALRLLTESAFDETDDPGSDATLSLELEVDGEAATEVPIEATLINDPELIEGLADSMERARGMFDPDEIQEEKAVRELASAYGNIVNITKELGIGSTDYSDAAKELESLRDNFLKLGKFSHISLTLETRDFNPDPYVRGYDNAATALRTAADNLRDGSRDTEKAADKYAEARSHVRERAYDWHEEGGAVAFATALDLTNDKAEEYELPDKEEDELTDDETIFKEYETLINESNHTLGLTKPLLVLTASPVNTTVTDPKGRVLSPEQAEIPSSSYHELDLTGGGTSEDLAVITDRIPGSYRIDVTPDENANPEDTYSLAVSDGETDSQLVDSQEVADESDDTYSVSLPSPDEGGLPTDPGEPTFQDVLNIINDYNNNTQFNGVDVTFQDVLEVINAFNAQP